MSTRGIVVLQNFETGGALQQAAHMEPKSNDVVSYGQRTNPNYRRNGKLQVRFNADASRACTDSTDRVVSLAGKANYAVIT